MSQVRTKWISGVNGKTFSEQLEEMENLLAHTCSEDKLGSLYGKLNYKSSITIIDTRIHGHGMSGGRYAIAKGGTLGGNS